MEEENQEVENSPHGSVTGEGPSGGANIIGQQLTPPSPPPRPQAVERVRMAEDAIAFLYPSTAKNFEFSPARERIITLQRAVRRLGTQLEGFRINTDLQRHQRAAKKRIKRGQYKE